ncbi:MAG: hypothetical protein CfClM3_0614 [Methanobrevibacter sp. CfCl-M3]
MYIALEGASRAGKSAAVSLLKMVDGLDVDFVKEHPWNIDGILKLVNAEDKFREFERHHKTNMVPVLRHFKNSADSYCVADRSFVTNLVLDRLYRTNIFNNTNIDGICLPDYIVHVKSDKGINFAEQLMYDTVIGELKIPRLTVMNYKDSLDTFQRDLVDAVEFFYNLEEL